jgi:hypothetical protein
MQIKGGGFNQYLGEGVMSHRMYLEGSAWMKREKTKWCPKPRLIMAFVLGFLVLLPVILGIYCTMF